MVLSGLKTWLETGQTLTTPGSLMYGELIIVRSNDHGKSSTTDIRTPRTGSPAAKPGQIDKSFTAKLRGAPRRAAGRTS